MIVNDAGVPKCRRLNTVGNWLGSLILFLQNLQSRLPNRGPVVCSAEHNPPSLFHQAYFADDDIVVAADLVAELYLQGSEKAWVVRYAQGCV